MTLSEVCKPNEPIVASGLGLIKLHQTGAGAKIPVIEVVGTGAGGVLAHITIPEGCAVEGLYPITGTLYIEEPDGQFEVDKAVHKVKENSLSTLKFGGRLATIAGTGLLSIKEGGVAKEFSVLSK